MKISKNILPITILFILALVFLLSLLQGENPLALAQAPPSPVGSATVFAPPVDEAVQLRDALNRLPYFKDADELGDYLRINPVISESNQELLSRLYNLQQQTLLDEDLLDKVRVLHQERDAIIRSLNQVERNLELNPQFYGDRPEIFPLTDAESTGQEIRQRFRNALDGVNEEILDLREGAGITRHSATGETPFAGIVGGNKAEMSEIIDDISNQISRSSAYNGDLVLGGIRDAQSELRNIDAYRTQFARLSERADELARTFPGIDVYATPSEGRAGILPRRPPGFTLRELTDMVNEYQEIQRRIARIPIDRLNSLATEATRRIDALQGLLRSSSPLQVDVPAVTSRISELARQIEADEQLLRAMRQNGSSIRFSIDDVDRIETRLINTRAEAGRLGRILRRVSPFAFFAALLAGEVSLGSETVARPPAGTSPFADPNTLPAIQEGTQSGSQQTQQMQQQRQELMEAAEQILQTPDTDTSFSPPPVSGQSPN